MRIWDQSQPGLLTGMGKGKGTERNNEPTEEVHGWEGLALSKAFGMALPPQQ